MELSHWNQKNIAETTGATEMERIESIERGGRELYPCKCVCRLTGDVRQKSNSSGIKSPSTRNWGFDMQIWWLLSWKCKIVFTLIQLINSIHWENISWSLWCHVHMPRVCVISFTFNFELNSMQQELNFENYNFRLDSCDTRNNETYVLIPTSDMEFQLTEILLHFVENIFIWYIYSFRFKWINWTKSIKNLVDRNAMDENLLTWTNTRK